MASMVQSVCKAGRGNGVAPTTVDLKENSSHRPGAPRRHDAASVPSLLDAWWAGVPEPDRKSQEIFGVPEGWLRLAAARPSDITECLQPRVARRASVVLGPPLWTQTRANPNTRTRSQPQTHTHMLQDAPCGCHQDGKEGGGRRAETEGGLRVPQPRAQQQVPSRCTPRKSWRHKGHNGFTRRAPKKRSPQPWCTCLLGRGDAKKGGVEGQEGGAKKRADNIRRPTSRESDNVGFGGELAARTSGSKNRLPRRGGGKTIDWENDEF